MAIFKCLECYNEFKDVNRISRPRKFCSSRCCNSYHGKKRYRTKPNNTTCSYCKKGFYRHEGNKHSRSGLYFCNKKCKNMGQRISSGISEIRPSHYKDGSSTYSRRAKEFLDVKCVRCGYDKIKNILEVHHKDRDRTNNKLSNLEVLCPTCHAEEHFLNKKTKNRPIV